MRRKVMAAAALTLIGLGLLSGCSLLASGSRSSQTATLPKNEGVVRTTLKNGLEVVIVPSKLAPAATSVLTYRVGSGRTPKGSAGIVHSLQQLLLTDAPGVSAGQLTAIGRVLGGDLSSETTESATRFIFTVPAVDLGVALHLEALGMKGLAAGKGTWSDLRRQLDSEILADYTNPQYTLSARLRADLFKGSRYARDALGSPSSVDAVSLAQLRDFYKTWYGPNNAILVIAGDVVPSEVLSEVRALFSHLPPRSLPTVQRVHLRPVVPESLALTSRLAYGAAAIAMRFPGRTSPDYPAALVLSEIVRGRADSLAGSAGAFGVAFTYDAFPRAGMGLLSAAYAPKGDGAAVEDGLMLALARFMNGGISRGVVRGAKLATELHIEAKMDSTSGLALAWSRALSAGESSPGALLSAVAKVTPGEVNRVAVRYIDLGKAEFATLTPAASGPRLPLASQGFAGSEPIDLSGPASTSVPTWARSALTARPMPAAMRPKVFRLSNGLRLIVQQESNSGVVELRGLVDSNPYMQVPKGEGGVDEVLGQLVSGGTSLMNKKAFRAALDEIGAKESAGTSFSLSVLSGRFDRGLQLLADNLLHPAITAAGLSAAKKLIAEIIAARRQDPTVHAREDFLKAVLPATDPALREATAKSVGALTLAEVQSYYRSVFRPDMTTIVVVGNIDPAAAKVAVERYFGGWRASGKRPDILLPAGSPNGASVRTVVDKNSPVAQVRLAELIPMVRSNRSYYALKLGNAILSGNSYPGRFATDLAAAGLSVSYLSSSLLSGRSRSFYLVDYATDPASVKQAAAVIRNDITALQKSPPSAAEVARARGGLLSSLVLGEDSYGSIASALLDRVRLALPLDAAVSAAQAYATLTPSEVSAAMAKWVRPGGFAEVIQGPASGH